MVDWGAAQWERACLSIYETLGFPVLKKPKPKKKGRAVCGSCSIFLSPSSMEDPLGTKSLQLRKLQEKW
jgi:hypothetical protein